VIRRRLFGVVQARLAANSGMRLAKL
jgi:hypothetical protein